MNRVILAGNIVYEPETRTTQSGLSQCTFRIAVSRRFANAQGVRESDFFTVVCWRQTADFVARWFHKGMRVIVEGSVQTRSYDAQDGSKRYVTEIIADNCEFGGNRSDNPDAARTSSPAPSPAQPNSFDSARPAAPAAGFTEVDDDELPF